MLTGIRDTTLNVGDGRVWTAEAAEGRNGSGLELSMALRDSVLLRTLRIRQGTQLYSARLTDEACQREGESEGCGV